MTFRLVKLERFALFIDQDLKRPGNACVQVFVAPHKQIDKSVSVEISPAGAPRTRSGQFGKGELGKLHFSLVAIKFAGIPRKQVDQPIVVKIGSNRDVDIGHAGKRFAFVVFPDPARDAEVDPAIIIQIDPAGGIGGDFKSHLFGGIRKGRWRFLAVDEASCHHAPQQ